MDMKKKNGTWTLNDGNKDLTSGSLKHVMIEKERRKKKKKKLKKISGAAITEKELDDDEETATRPTMVTGVY